LRLDQTSRLAQGGSNLAERIAAGDLTRRIETLAPAHEFGPADARAPTA
jgi:hypothetical protein